MPKIAKLLKLTKAVAASGAAATAMQLPASAGAEPVNIHNGLIDPWTLDARPREAARAAGVSNPERIWRVEAQRNLPLPDIVALRFFSPPAILAPGLCVASVTEVAVEEVRRSAEFQALQSGLPLRPLSVAPAHPEYRSVEPAVGPALSAEGTAAACARLKGAEGFFTAGSPAEVKKVWLRLQAALSPSAPNDDQTVHCTSASCPSLPDLRRTLRAAAIQGVFPCSNREAKARCVAVQYEGWRVRLSCAPHAGVVFEQTASVVV